MGWNSWNTFGKNIDQTMLRQVVDAIVSSGMKDAGYTYVTVDDGWQLRRVMLKEIFNTTRIGSRTE